MAIEGRLNFADVKDQLFDEFGNRKVGRQIVVFDKGSDGLWHHNESEKLDTLAGSYHVLDIDGKKKIYYQVGEINWAGHPQYGKPWLEHTVEKKHSLDEKIREAGLRASDDNGHETFNKERERE